MLGQRIITALLLLAVLLPAVFYPDTRVFGAVTVLLLAAAAWEWARLNGQSNVLAWMSGTVFVVCCVWFWSQGGMDDAAERYHLLWLVAALVWVLGGAWLLHGGVPAWSGLPVALRWPLGWLALALAWLAVNQARALGVNFLFSVLALVWMADSAAYFSGRAFGGRLFARKLAPSISPGKTWEGVCGGMLGVLLLAFVWHHADVRFGLSPSIYSHLWHQSGLLLVLGVVFLTAMSVVGDLVESLFKRSAGVKDSSALLPGHGGVLDRIDALLPTLPIAMMLMQR